MKKWEYCEISIGSYNGGYSFHWRNEIEGTSAKDYSSVIAILNYFGQQGWELVNTSKGYSTFKRELRSN